MIGPDNSWTGGIIGALTLFIANWAVTRVTYRHPTFQHLLQAAPTVLVENGKILQANLEKELLTLEDLSHALRKNQIDLETDLAYLRRVLFESDGSITIVRRIPDEKGFGIHRHKNGRKK